MASAGRPRDFGSDPPIGLGKAGLEGCYSGPQLQYTYKIIHIFIMIVLMDDESKTHLILSQFFKYIFGLKVQFNAKL